MELLNAIYTYIGLILISYSYEYDIKISTYKVYLSILKLLSIRKYISYTRCNAIDGGLWIWVEDLSNPSISPPCKFGDFQ